MLWMSCGYSNQIQALSPMVDVTSVVIRDMRLNMYIYVYLIIRSLD